MVETPVRTTCKPRNSHIVKPRMSHKSNPGPLGLDYDRLLHTFFKFIELITF